MSLKDAIGTLCKSLLNQLYLVSIKETNMFYNENTILITTFSLPLLHLLVNQSSAPFITNSKVEEAIVELEEVPSWHHLEVGFQRNTHTFC